ncbi:phosphoglycolate phosphatase [Breoghania sp. L-A4]|nr:phosphoglycolate phosphatase [Breoghania sp. L-A4]
MLDLDGTLVDTAPDLIATLNVVLASEKLAPVPLEVARSLIGHGARALLQKGFDVAGEPLDDAREARLFAAFIDHYGANIARHSRPFDGVEAALARFALAGWHLAVCTNKLEHLARSLLDELDMSRHFKAIVGADTFERRKPDAMPVLGAIELCGGDAVRSVMVGDSRTDIDAARNAGIPVVAVTFGYTPVPVDQLAPDRIISHFDDLWTSVQTLAPRATGS